MAMGKDRTSQTPATASSRPEIDAFLERVKSLGPAATKGKRGRLVFALDATMSRQPTWDSACSLQADMFREAASIGGLDIQLVYFRGLSECRASGWVAGAEKLAGLMSAIDCRGGHTQIGKVLSHARQEHAKQRVQALVFVGDAMEDAIDDLCAAAGGRGLCRRRHQGARRSVGAAGRRRAQAAGPIKIAHADTHLRCSDLAARPV